MSNLKVAWTIFKLKVVRALLQPLLKWHIKHIEKEQNIKKLEHKKQYEAVLRRARRRKERYEK